METSTETRKKRLATYRYHAIRVVLFVAACVCAVSGMLMLTMTNDKQTRYETVTSQVLRADAQANVLLIMSYDDSDVLTPLARTGVLDVMNRSAVAVDVEYMDAINHPKGSDAYRAWAEALTKKLEKDNPYHAIICADDEALTFVEDNHDELFAGMPVVFFNVNDFEHAGEAAKSGYATGIIEQGDAADILALAKELRPNATKCLVVVDNTPSGKGDKAQFEDAVAKVGGITAEYVNASQMKREALADRVKNAGNDTIVFFLDAFNDSSGQTYTRDASARFVSEASSQPVFGIATGGVGEGLVGTGYTDPERDGQHAADACIKVLNGTSPGTIDLETEGIGSFVFDAKVMEKYGIQASSLPTNAVMINESAFTWDSVRALLPPVGLMLLGILLILAFAFMGYRHSISDTREIIAQRNDLQHRFYHDQLTEKLNMRWFNELSEDPEREKAIKSIVEVNFVDFRDINDAYGRAAGDTVLTEFAERFEHVGQEFLVRSMGAEFLIGFTKKMRRESKELRMIEDLITKPVLFGDSEIDVDAHVGVANREDAGSVKGMVTGAELAVRESTQAGIGRAAVFYTERMRREMEEKIEITATLKQSIKDEDFVILYQPQVDARTYEVCGYEALVRMKGNSFYPGQFIPVAEMSGLIIEVDRIVTKKVVQQLATWKKRHKRLAPVAINFSAVQLKDEGYLDFLLDLLKENDVSPSLIKIEFTESLLMGDTKADDLIARLKNEGIVMALDDFGTGYTSLSRVTEIPAEIVKVDKSLVDVYATPGNEGVLDNLVRLVHGLGKTIIVEGVETADQLKICQDLGCEVIQGYYFSAPLLPEKAAQFKPLAGEDESGEQANGE